MTFDKEQLNADVKILEEKDIPKVTAENIALFKQAIEYVTFFDDSIPYMDRENMSEEVYDKLDNLKGFIEEAWDSIQILFMSDEEAKVNDPSYYRRAYYQ